MSYGQQDDTQSSRSGDTPVPPSQSTTNSSQLAENNSESGKRAWTGNTTVHCPHYVLRAQRASIRYQTLSADPVGCYGNQWRGPSEMAYRT